MDNRQQLAAMLAKMSPTEREQFIAEAMERANLKNKPTAPPMTFADFRRKFWRAYKPAPYDDAIDTILQGIADYVLSDGESGISKAMIFLPPRAGKTMRVSRLFPAWLLSQRPDLPILAASYGARLAEKNTRWVRNLLQRRDYQEAFPNVRLIGTAADAWETTAEGGMMAAGVGGAITGFGARLGIVDDPTKSRSEAESPLIRERLKEWYDNDFLSRIEEPGGAILILATRWHTDDLPGYLLSDENEEEAAADGWQVLSLPAIAEENDPLGRAPGEALWPDRYPIEWLEARKQKTGLYSFSALYQQQPIAREAGLFDCGMFKIVDTVPELEQVVRFYDLAVSAKTSADFTAGCKLARTITGDLIILDMYHRQAAPTTTYEAIVSNAQRDGTGTPIRLEAENSARVQLDFLLRDPRLHSFTIDAAAPQGDKYTRATPAASRVNAGQVMLLRASWNRSFMDELSVFSGSGKGKDDQVDSFSGAYSMLETVDVPFFGQAFVKDRPRKGDNW